MKRAARAIAGLQKAARYRRSGGIGGALLADSLEVEAQALLRPPQSVTISAGEVVPLPEAPIADDDAFLPAEYIKNTLETPDAIATDASEARTALATEVGVLELAVDAAASIQAKNSLEKMLAHELAAAHDASMRLLARSLNEKYPILESARLANTAAKLMDVFREGVLAIQKLRTGGRQTVVVQHVQVTGQAVVAGNIERGAVSEGVGGKNGERS